MYSRLYRTMERFRRPEILEAAKSGLGFSFSVAFSILPFEKGKGKGSGVWPSMVTHTRNLSSALTHPSAHSQQWTHTWSSGQPCCGARGAVPCSRVSPQSWYWRWREHLFSLSPTDNTCRTWESNLQPLGYKSNSLTIRPRLPLWVMIAENSALSQE